MPICEKGGYYGRAVNPVQRNLVAVLMQHVAGRFYYVGKQLMYQSSTGLVYSIPDDAPEKVAFLNRIVNEVLELGLGIRENAEKECENEQK